MSVYPDQSQIAERSDGAGDPGPGSNSAGMIASKDEKFLAFSDANTLVTGFSDGSAEVSGIGDDSIELGVLSAGHGFGNHFSPMNRDSAGVEDV